VRSTSDQRKAASFTPPQAAIPGDQDEKTIARGRQVVGQCPKFFVSEGTGIIPLDFRQPDACSGVAVYRPIPERIVEYTTEHPECVPRCGR
jgi:hypothetical protein